MDRCKIVFLSLFMSIYALSYSASEIQPIYEFNIPTRDVGFTPDGKYAIVAGAGINFFDLETGELKRQLNSDDGVCNFDITPDGQWLISGLYSYYADLWDLQTGTIIHRFGPHISDPQREIIDVAISSDKKWIMTNMRGGTGPFLWNAETFEKVHDFLSGAYVYFSKDSKSLINYDLIYNIPSLELIGKLTDFSLNSPLIVFSKTSNLFFTFENYFGFLRITVRDWDTQTILKAFTNPEMDQMSAGGIDVTPDDKIIVTGIATGEILFWDVEKETVIKRIKVMDWDYSYYGPDYLLPNPKFSPDGKYLITNCGSYLKQTARLYRVSDILQTSSIPNFSVQK